MTLRHTPPFRADHVGSFLRPEFLLDAREQQARGLLVVDDQQAVARRRVDAVHGPRRLARSRKSSALMSNAARALSDEIML